MQRYCTVPSALDAGDVVAGVVVGPEVVATLAADGEAPVRGVPVGTTRGGGVNVVTEVVVGADAAEGPESMHAFSGARAIAPAPIPMPSTMPPIAKEMVVALTEF